jgi:hypothetical protein
MSVPLKSADLRFAACLTLIQSIHQSFDEGDVQTITGKIIGTHLLATSPWAPLRPGIISHLHGFDVSMREKDLCHKRYRSNIRIAEEGTRMRL